MLDTFTLFTRPLMLFFSASQAIRWNCSLVLSVIVACMARSLAGGMYAPPLNIQLKCFESRFLLFLTITCVTISSIFTYGCNVTYLSLLSTFHLLVSVSFSWKPGSRDRLAWLVLFRVLFRHLSQVGASCENARNKFIINL